MYLPKITLSKLKDELYQDFVNIQKAWMDFDYDKQCENCQTDICSASVDSTEYTKCIKEYLHRELEND